MSEVYAVVVGGQKPRFYEKLETAKRVATWYRNQGYGRGTDQPVPVIKNYIMGWTLEV